MREIIEQSINDHQKAIDEAKSKLAALDKPKLRHGDYGYVKSNPDQLRFFVETQTGEMRHYEKEFNCADPFACACYSSYAILGNIFDDLKRNAVDLEEFEVSGLNYRDKFNALITDLGQIWIATNMSGATCDKAIIKEIHQKLGQMIAFAQRKAEK